MADSLSIPEKLRKEMVRVEREVLPLASKESPLDAFLMRDDIRAAAASLDVGDVFMMIGCLESLRRYVVRSLK